MKPLVDRWALVTGASRGIGQQVALALADEGCRLILHSRSVEATASLASRLREQGATVHSVAAELSDSAAVLRLADEVSALCGSLDILHNNAAVMTPYREDYLTVVPADYELSFRVNTIAPILLCNHVLPQMTARGWGRIVNVTSGIKDQPELMAYAASKAALDKFVYDTAPKLQGTGVTMNLLDPGWLRTDLGGPNAPGAVESVLPGALVPVLATDGVSGRWISAQDFAAL
ncbi:MULTISPECIES: SDR family NAD(P)-dependent oxidoreductase [unclassified Roseateles]|uniref:SDR family NAD(P)-dependent oxidoreductase n=1 Tax=unclassified Roseateles TaxID=2626991 RepID=UPI0006F2B2C6|nr:MULTISPECIES: SDR family oxidoreductase [unclassified Roseateles]KQW45433.1 short-chain dehydrogenase [Pelomonas sp. Root405]KRA72277.1 short-chain dehydrogenase [Pelomonas sp. Root662]